MYRNISLDSSKFKGCSPLQPSCNLREMKPAVGYYSYTNRCLLCKKNQPALGTFASPAPQAEA